MPSCIVSYSSGLMKIDSLIFLYLKISIRNPFLNDILGECRILYRFFFFLKKLEMFDSLPFFMNFDKEVAIKQTVFPVYLTCHFSFVTFNICSLFLVFSSLNMMFLSLSFLLFIMVGTCSISWIWKFPYLAKFRKHLENNIFTLFLLHFLNYFLCDTLSIQCPSAICYNLTGPKDSVLYFLYFSYLLFTWILHINLSSNIHSPYSTI